MYVLELNVEVLLALCSYNCFHCVRLKFPFIDWSNSLDLKNYNTKMSNAICRHTVSLNDRTHLPHNVRFRWRHILALKPFTPVKRWVSSLVIGGIIGHDQSHLRIFIYVVKTNRLFGWTGIQDGDLIFNTIIWLVNFIPSRKRRSTPTLIYAS